MSEDLRQLMEPFQLGNSSKRKYFHTFDELYRQSSVDHSISHNYSIWSVEPTTYQDEAYAVVVSRDAPNDSQDPAIFRNKTSDEIQLDTSMRMILYMKFGEFTSYHKFFKRFQGPGAKSSHQLIHDFDFAILDAHLFSKDGDLLTGMRNDILKLTPSQWRSLVCVLNKNGN